MTLLELAVVLLVLVALAALITPQLASTARSSRETVTEATFHRLRDVLVGSGGFDRDMRFALDASGRAVGHASGLPWPSPSDIAAGRDDHPQLRFLFVAPSGLPGFDAVAQVGWRGPYAEISSAGRFREAPARGFIRAYGRTDDPAPIDGWGNPIVIQFPDVPAPFEDRAAAARLVSAGPDGVLDTPADVLLPSAAAIGDDVVLFLNTQGPEP